MGNFCCNLLVSKSKLPEDHHLDIEKANVYSKYRPSYLETVKEDPCENSEQSEKILNTPF